MIRINTVLLTAALSLIMSAVQAGQQQQIPVSYLPYTINAPGDYYLTTDLVVNGASVQCQITINQTSGNVTLDMKGHNLTGPYNPEGGQDIGILVVCAPTGNGGVLVKNGTIQGFCNGLAIVSSCRNVLLSNVYIENITFSNDNTVGLGIGG
jgi:hypothetical protein